MWAFVQLFLDIALHRRGPDSVPPGRFVLGLLVVVSMAVALVSQALLRTPPAQALLETLLHLGFFLLFYYLLLTAMRVPARFEQTAGALLGTGVLLSLFAMPLLPLVAGARVDDGAALPVLALLTLLGLLLWSLDITAFVLSRALDRGYLVGVLIAVGYFLAESALRRAFLAD